jgi:hypothetical protein
VFQFAFAIVAVLWIGELYARSGAMTVLIPCLAVWILLLAIGMLNEGRERAQSLEFLRLLAIMPALLIALHLSGGGIPRLGWLAAAVYIFASAAWLLLARTKKLIVIKQ